MKAPSGGARFALAVALLLAPGVAVGQNRGPLPADDAGRCRYGAEHMIELGRKSLDNPRARAERVENRRRLLDEWDARLKRGEDPCAVYRDIHRAATTF